LTIGGHANLKSHGRSESVRQRLSDNRAGATGPARRSIEHGNGTEE
jgi:hypothetical protein